MHSYTGNAKKEMSFAITADVWYARLWHANIAPDVCQNFYKTLMHADNTANEMYADIKRAFKKTFDMRVYWVTLERSR